MARNISTTSERAINSTAAASLPLYLLEITHPDLSTPIRIVQDTKDVTYDGDTYIAMGFTIVPPDDMSKGLPKARLAVDNITRDLMQWLETSNGAQGASATIRVGMRTAQNTVDVIEWSQTLDLSDITVTLQTVSANLGYEDILNLPGVPYTYTPDTAQGLF